MIIVWTKTPSKLPEAKSCPRNFVRKGSRILEVVKTLLGAIRAPLPMNNSGLLRIRKRTTWLLVILSSSNGSLFIMWNFPRLCILSSP